MRRFGKYLFSFMIVAIVSLPMGATTNVNAEKTKTSKGFVYICNYYKKTAEIIQYKGDASVIEFPSKLDGCKVTKICSRIFDYPYQVTELIIPDTVKTIDNSAFYNCTNLKKVKLSKNLEFLGGNVFGNCSSLKSIRLPASLKEFGTVILGDYNSRNYAGTFIDCKSLKTVVFSKKCKIETIPPMFFRNCSALRTVNIPSSVTEIGRCAFLKCTSLKSIEMPANMKKIGDNAFNFCENLEKVKLNHGLEYISGYSFSSTALKKVVIPDTVVTLGNNIFDHCTKLKCVTVGSGIDTMLKELFNNCTSLTEVTLKDGVKVIGEGMFHNTAIQSITIPQSVEQIDDKAFIDCKSLKSVYILGNPDMGGFESGMETRLYGFAGSLVEKYAKDNGLRFTKIARPTKFMVTNTYDSTAKLTWNGVSGAIEYTIYRSTKGDGPYRKIATVKDTWYLDQTVTDQREYFYYIVMSYKAKNGTILSGIHSSKQSIRIERR